MTDDRINELADEAWEKFSGEGAWNTLDCTLHIRNAIKRAVAEQLAQHKDVEADARRYRWLRWYGVDGLVTVDGSMCWQMTVNATDSAKSASVDQVTAMIDAAIDSAIAAQPVAALRGTEQ